jgi:hypothetical protein
MDVLDLQLVGWLYTVGCALALLLGTWLTLAVYAQGEQGRRQLAERMLDDLLLFSIWLLGLAGGIGVLMEKSWSRWVLELFCWVLVVLAMMSAYGRWRAAPPPRGLLPLSLALFLFPILAFCAATVLTLRGETALRVLAG